MSLPEPVLDDLRFQDIVDQARLRIIRYCPEWTDYNLSDPGITLIELFAWMTEMILYRLNRVPQKNYVSFLNMLGVQLQPASSAQTELTFWLSTPFPITPEDTTVATVPQGIEVATRRTKEEEEVIFTTDEELIVRPPVLTQLRRDGDVNKNYLSRLGVEIFYAFNQERPEEGDTFYLGFEAEEDIGGHILQLTFECEETQATGIRREAPPLAWEASLGDGDWMRIAPSTRPGEKDTTGGLNNPHGKLVLYLPLDMQPDQIHGRLAYWVRCRFEPRPGEQGYTKSPRIRRITTHALGGTVRATHAVVQENEILGQSDGEPGQTFALENAPLLTLRAGETLLVEEQRDGTETFIPWEQVVDFANSTRFDRHFTLDTASGEIRLGPSVQQPNGAVRQYGRVPELGRQLRFNRYRLGGGTIGNVPENKLQVLKTAIPYVDQVTNLCRAEGGRDQESIDEAMLRARREMRAQQRAVTAEDFENFTRKASRAVARAKCRTPGKLNTASPLPPGMVELLVIPAAFDAIRAGDFSRLRLEEPLRREIVNYIDQYRLLTTTLNVKEPNYLGIQVTAEIVPSEYSHPEMVCTRVVERLQQFLSPLALSEDESLSEVVEQEWEGWPFGRDLYVSELFSLIQQVPGVKHVLDVQIGYREVVPGEEVSQQAVEEVQEEEDVEEEVEAGPPLTTLDARLLVVADDTVLCSLDHDVKPVEL